MLAASQDDPRTAELQEFHLAAALRMLVTIPGLTYDGIAAMATVLTEPALIDACTLYARLTTGDTQLRAAHHA